MAWSRSIFWLAQRLTVIAVAIALAASTVKASPATPPCDCGMKGECCEKTTPHKHSAKKNPTEHRHCPEGCKAVGCTVIALPAASQSRLATAAPSTNLHELPVGIQPAPAGDVILPPPRA